MTRHIKVNYSKFMAVTKDLREHPNLTQRSIAESHHLSQVTVSNIAKARTWGGWLAQKVSRQTSPKVSATEKQLATHISKLERARKAGLNPHTREDRAEAKFAAELEKLNERYATKQAVQSQIERLDDRIDVVADSVKKKVDKPTRAAEEAEARMEVRDTILTWIIAILALLAFIIALVK